MMLPVVICAALSRPCQQGTEQNAQTRATPTETHSWFASYGNSDCEVIISDSLNLSKNSKKRDHSREVFHAFCTQTTPFSSPSEGQFTAMVELSDILLPRHLEHKLFPEVLWQCRLQFSSLSTKFLNISTTWLRCFQLAPSPFLNVHKLEGRTHIRMGRVRSKAVSQHSRTLPAALQVMATC